MKLPENYVYDGKQLFTKEQIVDLTNEVAICMLFEGSPLEGVKAIEKYARYAALKRDLLCYQLYSNGSNSNHAVPSGIYHFAKARAKHMAKAMKLPYTDVKPITGFAEEAECKISRQNWEDLEADRVASFSK